VVSAGGVACFRGIFRLATTDNPLRAN
jgi:hypothetical protein